MTNLSAKSAKQNEHESVNEQSYRLLVATGLEFAKTAEKSYCAFVDKAREENRENGYERISWFYWMGIETGIRAGRGESGAREEMLDLIQTAKDEIKMLRAKEIQV